jgi:hypothetical protein
MGKNQAANLEPPAFETDGSGRIKQSPDYYDENEERDDADANQDRNSVECVNITSHTVKFEVAGVRYVVKSHQMIQLHRAYALPRKMQRNRDPIASVIEMISGKQVLACNDPRAASTMAGLR